MSHDVCRPECVSNVTPTSHDHVNRGMITATSVLRHPGPCHLYSRRRCGDGIGSSESGCDEGGGQQVLLDL